MPTFSYYGNTQRAPWSNAGPGSVKPVSVMNYSGMPGMAQGFSLNPQYYGVGPNIDKVNLHPTSPVGSPISTTGTSAGKRNIGGPPVMNPIAVGEPNPATPAPTTTASNYDPWAPGSMVPPTEEQLRARYDSRGDAGRMLITGRAAATGQRPIDILLNRWYRRHPGVSRDPVIPPATPTTPATPATPAAPALTHQGVMEQIANSFNGGANNVYDINRLFPFFGV